MLLKIGALAHQTGLTVRTLHHYDAIGLLTPSHRSDTGYRLYNRDDVARLHQIQSLKQLGFALADIGEMLAGDGLSLEDIVTKQLTVLERQLANTMRLRTQLLMLKDKMDQGGKPEMADLLSTLELMAMYDKYFTPEEIDSLNAHRKNAGPDLDARWATLVAAMQDAKDRHVDPAHPSTQALTTDWLSLLESTIGNDPGLLLKLDAMTRNEPAAQAQTGINPSLMDYVMTCIQARHATVYAKYLTPHELERVMEGRAKTDRQWPPLVTAMRKLYTLGATETDPQVQDLAAQWKVLFDVTHAGDDGALKAKLATAYAQEPELLRGTGLDLPLLMFVGRAMSAL